MVTNERLRGSLASDWSSGLLISPRPSRSTPRPSKRWITKGRIPRRAHRVATAKRLNGEETYLWAELLDDPLTQTASQAGLLQLYPNTWNGDVGHLETTES